MARRSRLLVPGVLYHAIVRGNHRRKTFLNDSDYQAYLERFGRYRKCLGVIVYAYRLMPNHIHLWSRHGDGEFFDFWFRGAAEVNERLRREAKGLEDRSGLGIEAMDREVDQAGGTYAVGIE